MASCTFFNTLSWRDDQSPLPIGINPRVTFERMFGETGTPEQRMARLKERQSLLDSVLEETGKLRHSLGAPDKAILDEYLNNIRDVEHQLDRMETRMGDQDEFRGPAACRKRSTITDDQLQPDAPAFQGDISRVFTFMVGHEAATADTRTSGSGDASQHSHHGTTRKAATRRSARIRSSSSRVLDKLKTTKDGDGAARSRDALLGQRHE